jgi:hypothetical protein
MPAPLQRLLSFAGRWPGRSYLSRSPLANRFSAQDQLCTPRAVEDVQPLQFLGDRLVFVWENQCAWIAATERDGADAPVWISENYYRGGQEVSWRQLKMPLSHFLVSFVLQELVLGSEIVALADGALERFAEAGVKIESVWPNGEYTHPFRPSYFLAAGRFLIRRAPEHGDGSDWYGCNSAAGEEELKSLGLPAAI